MTDQPRWPAGTPVAPSGRGPGGGRFRAGRRAGRDLTDWSLTTPRLRNVELEHFRQLSGGRSGDLFLRELAREQGWEDPAQVGTQAEADALVDAGGVELWRASEGFEQWRDEDYLYYGGGYYGNGWYASVDPDVAAQFGEPRRMVLHPDARVIDKDDLWEHEQRLTALGVSRHLLMDDGRLAALLGYDAIRVRGAEDAPDPRYADQYILLNRTAVVVADDEEAESRSSPEDWADHISGRFGG